MTNTGGPVASAQTQLEEAADKAVTKYAQTMADADAIAAANAISKAFRNNGSEDLRKAITTFQPAPDVVFGDEIAVRIVRAKHVVEVYSAHLDTYASLHALLRPSSKKTQAEEAREIGEAWATAQPRAPRTVCDQCGHPVHVTAAPKRWRTKDGTEEDVFSVECDGPVKHRGDIAVPV
jgi:hypothetical protein